MVPPDAPILSASAMRAAELAMIPRGVSLATLMERAGAMLADLIWRVAAGREVLILCGPGNNGGDGYVAARLLRARGAMVRIAANAAPSSELARAAAEAWADSVEILSADTPTAPILVDALFGTGLTRPLPPELTAHVARLAKAAQRRLAVDLPSGIASDSGQLLSPVPHYDVTLAFGALKPAHVLLPAAAYCGDVRLADIGILTETSTYTLPRWHDVMPSASDHKYSRGQVLVVAGEMAGAAGLAAAAAFRAGAGHVLLSGTGTPPLLAIVKDELPLADRLGDRRLGAVVIGPGAPAGEALSTAVATAISAGKPMVLDAAAIDAALPLMAKGGHAAIMTPHSGEFEHAFGLGPDNKIDRTFAAARRTGAVIIHKGADTVIASPDGRVAAGWPGSPHLASAGTGDVLAGACGAMLARGYAPFEAACRAVLWHHDVARRLGAGLIADDLTGPRP
jgi:hydroxyethylthiazole kinase-like uncharacterized protein yjeF